MYGFSALWAALLLPLLTKLPHAQSLPDEWVLTKPSEGDRLQADEWTTIEWNLAQPIDVAIFQLIVIWTNGTESFWESLGGECMNAADAHIVKAASKADAVSFRGMDRYYHL